MLVIQPHTDVFQTGKVLVPEVRIKMRLYFNSPVLLLNGVGLAGRLQPEEIEMRFHLCMKQCTRSYLLRDTMKENWHPTST